ncbi:MAG: hypothetical protein NVSMB10_07180 [Steroidobacteraceae bacterium]
MFKRVLLCHDGTEGGRRALRRGAELAMFIHAEVHVLVVLPSGVEDPFLLAGAAGHACIVEDCASPHRAMLDESIKWLKDRGVAASGYLTRGDTIEQISLYTKRLAIDLIVLGHYPRPSGGFWWSGSGRVSLAEKTRCCVLVAVDVAPAGGA